MEADTGHAVNEVMEDASVTIDEIVLDKAPGIMEAARVSGEYSNLDNSGTYYLGNSIPVYNYVDNMIEIASVKYYPVIFNENVIGIIIARLGSENEVLLEYSEAFVSELNTSYKLHEAVCIVFTNDCQLVYLGDEVKKINVEINIDPNFTESSSILKKDTTIKKETVNKLNEITYSPIATRGTVTAGYKTLSVPKKIQADGSSYCWACVATSVGQFKKPNVVLDPKNIAREYSGNLTTRKPISTIKQILSDKYNLSTSTNSFALKMSDVQRNIKANNPIASYVSYNLISGHFIVVRGYSVNSVSASTTYFVYIMDPLYSSGYRTLEVSAKAIDKEIQYSALSSGNKYNITKYLEL